MDLEELQKLFTKEFGLLKTSLETQASEIKEFGETKKVTADAITKASTRIEELKAEIDVKIDVKNVEIVKLLEAQKLRIDEMEKASQRPGYGAGGEIKSPGELFTDSDAYKNMMAAKALNSNPLHMKSLFEFEQKVLTATITGGTLTQALRMPEILMPPVRATRVRDLLTVRSVTTDSIEFVKETGFTNLAAPVIEAAEKPESAITFSLETQSVRTIAHWIPISRQVLADVNQLRAYVDTRLIYGIKLVEDQQILYGSGTSPNLAGIFPQASVYNWSDGKPGDTKLDCIRRAMTVARLAEYPVGGLVLHPSDWEDIELLKGSDEHYIWIVVTEGGVTRLFRTPVVETTAILSGEGLTGAFQLGAILWDREDANIRIAEQHEDFFIKNLVLVLAEERLCLTVFRPEAYVAITFDNAPVTT